MTPNGLCLIGGCKHPIDGFSSDMLGVPFCHTHCDEFQAGHERWHWHKTGPAAHTALADFVRRIEAEERHRAPAPAARPPAQETT